MTIASAFSTMRINAMTVLSLKNPLSVVVTCFVSAAVWAVANSLYLPFVAESQLRILTMDAGNWLTYKFLTIDALSYSASWLIFHRFLEIPEFQGIVPIAAANGMVFGVPGGWYCVAWSACRSLSRGKLVDFPQSAFRYVRWAVLFLLTAIAIAAVLSVREIWGGLEFQTASKYVVFTLAGTALATAIYLAVSFAAKCGIALHQLFRQRRF